MTDRRYSDDEIAEIFKRATESRAVTPRHRSASEGLSLTELQGIGREVGLTPEAVSLAARSLEQGNGDGVRKLLGFPIGVGETVELGRELSDAEWDLLVVAARETFGARGTLRTDGAFRQWTNGNLQVLLEPTEHGHRVRFRTYNANAKGLMVAGVALAGFPAIAMAAALFTSSANAGALTSIASLMAVGAALFTIGAARLPMWARLRRAQMQRLAAKLEAPKQITE
jgi:hypothetical protein